MRRLNVLISGAGIAGCTLAYWLARYGHAVTVVERSGALRSSGAPVDIRGPAADVAARMGITARLREACTRISGITILDGAGRRSARVDLVDMQRLQGRHDIEVPRGDLSTILHHACGDSVEFIYGDSIASLAQDESGVDVGFEKAAPRRFDLVIGADGLHSNVRRLAFGSESSFVCFEGLYVATLPLPASICSDRDLFMLNAPGKCVGLHPSRDVPLGMFVFWSEEIPGIARSDERKRKALVSSAFAGIGWKVPEILAALGTTGRMYFDSVSRVRLADWWRGRVALLGDAAACVSLFGDGSSLAMVGADTLARALADNPIDHVRAFRQYQERHGKLVRSRHRTLSLVASLLIPRTRLGIALRNQVLVRALSAIAKLKGIGRSA